MWYLFGGFWGCFFFFGGGSGVQVDNCLVVFTFFTFFSIVSCYYVRMFGGDGWMKLGIFLAKLLMPLFCFVHFLKLYFNNFKNLILNCDRNL